MTETQTNEMTPVENLDALLDAERAALIAGDLEALNALLTPKEELIDALNSTPSNDRDTMQQLDRKVRRNQILLDSALEGIRTVASRLARLRESEGALETYGADGKKHDIIARGETSVERRA